MIYLTGIDTETCSAIATLAAQFALGIVERPESPKTEVAIEGWGNMGFISPTGEQVKSAVDEAVRLADNLSVDENETEESLRKKILGW